MSIPDERFNMFRNRLVKVFRHLGRQARRAGVSCYRVYDHDLPEFPFCIELNGEKIYMAEYRRRHGMTESEHNSWLEKCLMTAAEVLGTQPGDIFLKLRQRKPGRLGQYQKFGEIQHVFEVLENGLKFIVNLSDYLDTGLFLDHRNTRQMVREKSKGKKVLNLFAYTGSFSVYAAAGGAAEVVTVDLSKTYLEWAGRNLAINGYEDPVRYPLVHADVKQYLKMIPPESFDLIIMDPPTFSNSQRMADILDIQRDHAELINDCLVLLRKDGLLYFSTNYRKFILDTGKIKGASVRDITRTTTPFDFEGRLFRSCYLFSK
ncbi:MAG: class I SAM-dependent methyltransferase [Chitinophagaceae bacterium]